MKTILQTITQKVLRVWLGLGVGLLEGFGQCNIDRVGFRVWVIDGFRVRVTVILIYENKHLY